MKSTFVHAVALITIFAAATRAIGFVFRIFLSRLLGAELLGVYQIALSFFMVFVTIIASGLPLIISKETAAIKSKEQDPRAYRKAVLSMTSAGLILSLMMSIIICVIVLAGQYFFSGLFTDQRSMQILIVLIPSTLAYSVYTTLRAVWWGEKRFMLLGLTELAEQIIRVIVLVVFLLFAFLFVDLAQLAAFSYLVALFLGAILVVIIFLKTTREKQRVKMADAKPYLKPLLKSSTPITTVRGLASIALPIIAITLPWRLVATGMSHTEAISLFGIMVGMTLPLLTIPQTVISSIATALVPELSAAVQNNRKEEVKAKIVGCIKFTLMINFLLLPVFMAVGTGIGVFLFDEPYAGYYLVRSAWVMIPISLSQITNTILNSMGAETKAMKNYIIGSVFLFLAIWFLPYYIGVNALVVGLGICMMIASVLNLILISKLTGVNTNIIGLSTAYIAFSLPAIFIGGFVYGIVSNFFSSFFSIGFGGAASVIVLLTLAYMFNMVDLKSIRKSSGSKGG